MRIIFFNALVATTTLAFVGTAIAAELTGDEIKTTFIGKTIYTETTTASSSGQAGATVVYRADDGTALLKAPNGTILQGKWEIKGNSLCTEWKGRPSNCLRYDKQGDTISSFDVKSGAAVAKITKIVPGNAEKLAP